MVSIHVAATSVTQSARAQWDNLSRAANNDQRMSSHRGFKDSIDSLLRTMFANCTGDIGGIPREEIGETFPANNPKSPQQPLARKQSHIVPAASPVPFEVAARSHSDVSRSSRNSPSPAPKLQKESLDKLRQLGAQHQLASGVYGEALADVARPSSPEKTKETPDLVDFDDGISAISSHTLEEMEKRRLQQGGGTTNPPRGKLMLEARHVVNEDIEWQEDVEFMPFAPLDSFSKPVEISRNVSTNTRQTNATEESFRMFMQTEAKYWEDEVRGDERRNGRGAVRPSIEERARRLRELSRSRSRSDGTGSVSYG
ncbi:hypothetical protein HJC23_010013 [Cyclotella cryptica]|uniref:Uncharacterized protein n=1 Tax=Cyclotella cryptica TaxID=29204 RepID=A0ABD3Q8Q0_9STRA